MRCGVFVAGVLFCYTLGIRDGRMTMSGFRSIEVQVEKDETRFGGKDFGRYGVGQGKGSQTSLTFWVCVD